MSHRFCGFLFSILIASFLLTTPVAAQYGQTVTIAPPTTSTNPPPVVTIIYHDTDAAGQVLGTSTAPLSSTYSTLSSNLGRLLRALADPNSNSDTNNSGQILGATQNSTNNLNTSPTSQTSGATRHRSGQVLGASTEELPVSGNFLGSALLGAIALVLIVVGTISFRNRNKHFS